MGLTNKNGWMELTNKTGKNLQINQSDFKKRLNLPREIAELPNKKGQSGTYR